MKVKADTIRKTVGEYYGLPKAVMMSRSRVYQIARPRMIAMMLTRELTGLSLPRIGKLYGGKHHTTVISAIKRVPQIIAKSAKVAADMIAIRALLSAFEAEEVARSVSLDTLAAPSLVPPVPVVGGRGEPCSDEIIPNIAA